MKTNILNKILKRMLICSVTLVAFSNIYTSNKGLENTINEKSLAMDFDEYYIKKIQEQEEQKNKQIQKKQNGNTNEEPEDFNEYCNKKIQKQIYILNCLENNKNTQEIKFFLEEKGYPENEIENVIKNEYYEKKELAKKLSNNNNLVQSKNQNKYIPGMSLDGQEKAQKSGVFSGFVGLMQGCTIF
jgi:hypothetical protein